MFINKNLVTSHLTWTEIKRIMESKAVWRMTLEEMYRILYNLEWYSFGNALAYNFREVIKRGCDSLEKREEKVNEWLWQDNYSDFSRKVDGEELSKEIELIWEGKKEATKGFQYIVILKGSADANKEGKKFSKDWEVEGN